jgi:hypothetical protein
VQRFSKHPCSINNISRFRQKYLGVLDCSDSSDETSYPLTENYTLPVAYIPPLLCTWKVVTYKHYHNDRCVILVTGVAVMLQLLTQSLAIVMPCSGRVPHFTSSLLLYIRCRSFSTYVYLRDVVTYYNTVFPWDTSLAVPFASPLLCFTGLKCTV